MSNGRQGYGGPFYISCEGMRDMLVGFTTIYDPSDSPKIDVKFGEDNITTKSLCEDSEGS